MFDKFKEFIGIDDNYDDYDEDQAYYEDEEKEDLTSRESYASLLDDNQSSFESNTKTYESEYSG